MLKDWLEHPLLDRMCLSFLGRGRLECCGEPRDFSAPRRAEGDRCQPPYLSRAHPLGHHDGVVPHVRAIGHSATLRQVRPSVCRRHAPSQKRDRPGTQPPPLGHRPCRTGPNATARTSRWRSLGLPRATNSPLWVKIIVRQHDKEDTPVDHGLVPVIHRYPRHQHVLWNLHAALAKAKPASWIRDDSLRPAMHPCSGAVRVLAVERTRSRTRHNGNDPAIAAPHLALCTRSRTFGIRDRLETERLACLSFPRCPNVPKAKWPPVCTGGHLPWSKTTSLVAGTGFEPATSGL
jgi:hypothetical protein